MNQSTSIAQLADALATAQSEMEAAKKDSSNPFFKSKYADLASVWEACRGPLGRHGLSVCQMPETIDGPGIIVTTLLMHSSGEWISSQLKMLPVKDDPQGIGSAITYMRRYALAAAVGIAAEDDDANAASGKKPEVVTESARVFTRKVEASPQPRAASIGPTPTQFPTTPLGPMDLPELPDYIDHKSQVEFASLFRESLPSVYRKEAEVLRHQWLGMRGYVDENGNPTSTVIPRKDFVVVRRMGAMWAREYNGALPTL